ncbi:hypothetical protein V0288_24640 [Pannus brasiliensis CCIBt3594]|uniref:ABC transporter permease n=1 Tax=Pannus brasiliensis CCIBt3594 TaxID=1427578 RepID=A0AAW9QTC9_9CHRO
MIATSIERVTETNPQLAREWQGRLTPKNLMIATTISIVGQALVYLYFRDLLPTAQGFNRYCTASPPPTFPNYSPYPNQFCIQDLNGQWMILSELWWLDIFTFLSVVGIFALLVVGTYQLIADISTEERQGTLNFIRLSPRSARDIFIGKILGVPVLLYWVAILALPFHLVAGLSAGIPFGMILAFYAVLLAGCAFFYCASIAFALASQWLGGFQAWLGSGTVAIFLFFTTLLALSGYASYRTPFDWLNLFYPGFLLPYLVKATFLPPYTVRYLGIQPMSPSLWYGQSLWESFPAGMGLLLLNFGVWTYWLTRALRRRFHNPLATLVSKTQSYGMTACFCILTLGFLFQTLEPSYLADNFAILTAFLAIYSLFLVIVLTPSRQAVQDWARYRHQNGEKGMASWKALLFSEKSPAIVAIATNLAIAAVSFVPALLIAPLDEYKLPMFGGFLLTVNMMLVYAALAAWVMLWKTNQRSLLATGTIATAVMFPVVCFGALGILPFNSPLLWGFSFLPVLAARYATIFSFGLAFLGQSLVLTLLALQINRQVRQIGASATKALLSEAK